MLAVAVVRVARTLAGTIAVQLLPDVAHVQAIGRDVAIGARVLLGHFEGDAEVGSDLANEVEVGGFRRLGDLDQVPTLDGLDQLDRARRLRRRAALLAAQGRSGYGSHAQVPFAGRCHGPGSVYGTRLAHFAERDT